MPETPFKEIKSSLNKLFFGILCFIIGYYFFMGMTPGLLRDSTRSLHIVLWSFILTLGLPLLVMENFLFGGQPDIKNQV